MKSVFICFPLYHPDQTVVEARIKAAKEYCRELLKEGTTPISPALFGLAIKEEGEKILFEYWQDFCFSYLEMAGEVHVLKFEGHETSKGVAAEIEKAKCLGLDIIYIDEKI